MIENDIQYMQRAIELAQRGQYIAHPNPMVGCVIVKDDTIIGEGWHQGPGTEHAEPMALKLAGDKAHGATLYVNLEPCTHFGKTPPCSDAVIAAGISRVVIANTDPNTNVSGNGIEKLQSHGITVCPGVLESEGAALNKHFFHFHTQKRPYVIAKWAMSLDGKMVTHPSDSRQITNQGALQSTHQTRATVDAILVGSQTALLDDPQLTVRHGINVRQQPLKIVLTTQDSLPKQLTLLGSDRTIIATSNKATNLDKAICWQLRGSDNQARLNSLMDRCYHENITSLLVEGGRKTIEGFLTANLVDETHTYIANNLIAQLPTKKALTITEAKEINNNFFIKTEVDPCSQE